MKKILGVMTGTSLDALDAVCVSVPNLKVLWSGDAPMPAGLRGRLLEIQAPHTRTSLRDLLVLERDVSRWFSDTLLRLLKNRTAAQRPDCIGIHGQTIAHFPKDSVTLQLGDPALVSTKLHLPVCSHFRHGNLAAGGQGAPLVPAFLGFWAATLSKKLKTRRFSVHNLGGISNYAWVEDQKIRQAYDTGPGGLWIDGAVRLFSKGKKTFDTGGALAKKGKIDHASVTRLLKGAYFRLKPPKSTGRDDFPFEMLLKTTSSRGLDLIATATEFTARSIAESYAVHTGAARLRGTPLIFYGGGALNHTLLSRIQALLPEAKVSSVDALGIPCTKFEAFAFAGLTYQTLLGQDLGGSWTGARLKHGSAGWWTFPATGKPLQHFFAR